jgi:hypothetical protein
LKADEIKFIDIIEKNQANHHISACKLGVKLIGDLKELIDVGKFIIA